MLATWRPLATLAGNVSGGVGVKAGLREIWERIGGESMTTSIVARGVVDTNRVFVFVLVSLRGRTAYLCDDLAG